MQGLEAPGIASLQRTEEKQEKIVRFAKRVYST